MGLGGGGVTTFSPFFLIAMSASFFYLSGECFHLLADGLKR